MNFSKVAVWLVIALVLFTVFKQFETRPGASSGYLGYSDFLEEVRAKRIKTATIQEGQGGTEITAVTNDERKICLLYTSPSPRDGLLSRMPSSA